MPWQLGLYHHLPARCGDRELTRLQTLQGRPQRGVGAALLLMLSASPADAAQTALMAPAAPVATLPPERSPAEQLEQAVGDIFKLIAKPDPRYAAFASLSSDVRLSMVETKIDGNSDTMMFTGKPAVKQLLTKLFAPAVGAEFLWSEPQTMVDGAYGRVMAELTIVEGERRSQKQRIYADAVREKPGWWTVTQILITWRDDWWKGD